MRSDPAAGPGPASPRADDAVELTIPASSAYLALARAATASTCARLNFPLDRMEDVALAVDEAISLLLLDAVPGSTVTCRWTPRDGGILIEVTSVSSSGRPPRTTTFAWTVLTALVTHASATQSNDHVTVALVADTEPLAVS